MMGEEENNRTEFITNSDGSITLDDVTIPPPPAPALTVDATKERLIITELLVRDFKSYAGSHILGPFNKNFSCIVGPNGSGKSNVIDALLFVFGYRAQKIRSKKVSVLIHKSHKFPDLNSCSVTVNFAMIKDDGLQYTICPNSQFCVTRTGYKDNSSTYEINGKRSQYKDVANLLRSYGIDLDYNRFMILQGEIELISMMKPKGLTEQDAGMLEYIEDIIGSNRFIKPIQHFHSKMEEVNEKRLEKLNHLKIVEKERADAEKPRNKAMEYLDLANKLVLMQNTVLQTDIMLAGEEAEKLNAKKVSVAEKVKELSESLEEVQAGKSLKENEFKAIMNDYDACLKTVEEYQQQFTELEHTDAACRENIKNNKNKLKTLTQNLDAEEKKAAKIKDQPEVLQKEITELEAKKERQEAAKETEEKKLTELMGSMKNEIEGFQEEKDNLENELLKLQETVNQKKSDLDLAQSELDLCLSSERNEKEKLTALENEYSRITTSIEEEENASKKGAERLHEIKSKVQLASAELTEKENQEIHLNEELKNMRAKIDEATNSLSASQNRSSITKALSQEKKKGRLMGVYGRLGDLGAIDSKYDVAISTACGSLDHIVTDTIVTAQECVQFLKQNNLGYTTFIALDKMKVWEPYTKQNISTPENIPRLFDLISVKDKDVLPAFYFALRDTLVANNLEQATRVGLQGSSRYRVVTLKGELIDLSGTMSGGGGKIMKGRMGQTIAESNVSQEEINHMNKEAGIIVEKLTEIKKLKLELKEIIEQGSKEIINLQHSIKKSQMNYNGFVDQEKNLKQQIKEQKVKVVQAAPDKIQIKELEKKIEVHRKNFDKATKSSSVVEDKVKGIQDQILSITKGKYGTVQKKIDSLTKEITQITQNIAKNGVLLKNSNKNLKKIEDKITSIKNEIENLQKVKEDLIEEFKSIEAKAVEVSKAKNIAEDVLKEKELLKAKVNGEIKSFTTAMNQVKSEILDLKNQVKLTDIEIRANEGRIRGLKSQLSKLELQEVEDGSTELPILTPEELGNVNINNVNLEIGSLQAKLKDMNPDLRAIAEFKRKEELYREKLKDLEGTIAERDHYRQHYETLRKLRLQEFMRGFNIITLKVKELYQMMTLGGDAELELVDSLDPFSEGVEYSVRPLRKSWKMVRNLSGGEKTLSSLSLVFALHYYRTTPFFVMDEIDAALDFRNVSIIGSYIKDCTKNAQFIVISLRENMFLLADHLVGIYKTNNRTKNVYLSPPIQPEVGDDSIAELTRGRQKVTEKDPKNRSQTPAKVPRVTFKTPEKENDSPPLNASHLRRTNSRNNVQNDNQENIPLSDRSNDTDSFIIPPQVTLNSPTLNKSPHEEIEPEILKEINASQSDDSFIIGCEDP